jgi:serine protease DegS
MAKKSWGRGLLFVTASIAAGLALAFLIVAWRPELVRPERVASPPPPAAPAARMPATISYADAVQRAAPAVVNIYTRRLVTERVAPSTLDELFGNFWPRYRRRFEDSLGSGVIVDGQGHIVTNHHVIANADSIEVQLADGRSSDATIVGRDPDTDLAVLRIGLRSLPVAPIGRSDRLRVGDVVLAIGNPIGLSQTVTHGIVSATGRQQLGVAALEDFIQTDAAINVGNSGGALVDTSGSLVGINTAIVAKNLGVEGIGFAIPVNMVRGVLADLLAQGRVIRGWVGFVTGDIPERQAQQLGLRDGGVLIANLYVGSPAQRAGLQPGDILLSIDDVPVRRGGEAETRVASHRPGVTLTLKCMRNGREIEVKTAVVERPRQPG